SLLKLGRSYKIETSHGGGRYLINCTARDLTENSGELLARYAGSDEPYSYTQIEISEISDDAKREIFDSAKWEDDLIRDIGLRYSIFIEKGLLIKYKNIPVQASCPSLRCYKSIEIQKDLIEEA